MTDLAQQRFNDYRRMALKIAGGFARSIPHWITIDDLQAAALMGLWRSVLVSLNREFRINEFEAYARIRIRGAIQDELRTQDQLSRRMRHLLRVSDQQIHFVSVDDYDPASPLIDIEEELDASAQLNKLRAAYEHLRPRLRQVLDAYLNGVPQHESALAMGISPPRYSQLLEKAREKLRSVLFSESSPLRSRAPAPRRSRSRKTRPAIP